MVFLSGLILGLSLIMSIGTQNLFIIRQGLRKHYSYQVALVCGLCDTAMIALGVAGAAQIIARIPRLQHYLLIAAIAFLGFYGLSCLRRGLQRKYAMGVDSKSEFSSLGKILLSAVIFSWLNPQAVFEAMVLIGGLANKYPLSMRYYFVLGIICANFLWFFMLAGITRRLQRYVYSIRFWRGLEFVSATIMLGTAVRCMYLL